MLLQLLAGILQQRLTLMYLFNQQALKHWHVALFKIIRICWTCIKKNTHKSMCEDVQLQPLCIHIALQTYILFKQK